MKQQVRIVQPTREQAKTVPQTHGEDVQARAEPERDVVLAELSEAERDAALRRFALVRLCKCTDR